MINQSLDLATKRQEINMHILLWTDKLVIMQALSNLFLIAIGEYVFEADVPIEQLSRVERTRQRKVLPYMHD